MDKLTLCSHADNLPIFGAFAELGGIWDLEVPYSLALGWRTNGFLDRPNYSPWGRVYTGGIFIGPSHSRPPKTRRLESTTLRCELAI